MTEKIDINEAFVTAASKGSNAKLKKILAEGANINGHIGKYGETALMLAVRNGHTDTVELLINKGADIEAKDEDGQTPLMFEAAWGDIETVKLLIDKGAAIEARDDDGNTPLMQAAKQYRTEIVKLLLKKGADIEAKDDDGQTALDLVMLDEILDDEPYSRRTEIIAFLKSKTAAKKRKAVSEKYGAINELKKASARDMSGWKTFPIEELFQAKKADVKDEIVPGKPVQPNAKGPIPVPVYAEPPAKRKPDEPEKEKSGGKSGTNKL